MKSREANEGITKQMKYNRKLPYRGLEIFQRAHGGIYLDHLVKILHTYDSFQVSKNL
jgi:hypothetical protein